MSFNNIRELLQANPLRNDLVVGTGDGRLDSALSETVVIDHLKTILPDCEIDVAPARYWYDIAITKDGKFFPINIKITNGNTADNISSKKGMYYALTGIRPEVEKGLDKWETFIQKLTTNYTESDADYYFIVCFKNSGELLFTSLKHIQTLVPNGNNLPFQCNWGYNRNLTDRSDEEQRKYVMDMFINSYVKRTPALDLLIQWRDTNE